MNGSAEVNAGLRRLKGIRLCWIVEPLLAYYATSVIVVIGVGFGTALVRPYEDHPYARAKDFWSNFAIWDSEWYRRIADEGYSYNVERMSNTAFYPAYPLAASLLAHAADVRTDLALVIISHICLLGAFIVIRSYVCSRFPMQGAETSAFVLMAVGLFPTTFYFRMAYTESMFLLWLVLTLYSMEKSWPLFVTVALVGVATATRGVGVALLGPLLVHLWRTSSSVRSFALRALIYAVLACWGIAAYAGYLALQFNEPLAFAKTQVHWGRPITQPLAATIWRLVTFSPVHDVYDALSPCCWRLQPPRNLPLFNLMFANPIYLLIAALSIVVGALKRWLNAEEVVLGALLLLIPYVTQSDRMCMASQARFASVVFPMYIVFGRALLRLTPLSVGLLCGICGLMLGIYSALFVSWYWFY